MRTRRWRRTGDGLLLAFAAAFLVMGVAPLLINLMPPFRWTSGRRGVSVGS